MSDVRGSIRVEELTVAYRTSGPQFRAVDGVSLSVFSGKAVGIVGESGSGKSTLLKAIATLPGQTANVSADRLEVSGVATLQVGKGEVRALRREELGIIMQDPGSALNPVISIGKQLNEASRIIGGRRNDRSNALSALEAVRLPDAPRVYRSYPHQLSGGMKQRVAIAMGLIQNPSILFADEPTSALDVTVERQIMELLRSIQKENHMTLFFVTHDLGLVETYMDFVYVMYGGRIVEAGPTEDVLKSPKHPYTAGLRASMPSTAEKPKTELPTVPGEPPQVAHLIDGCRFRPRCFLSGGRALCHEKDPDMHRHGAQLSACHFGDEIT